jgi:uncharacterized protein
VDEPGHPPRARAFGSVGAAAYPVTVHEPDQIVTAPEDRPPVGWGLGDAALGWLVAQFGGVVAVALVLVLSGTGADETDDLSLGWVAMGQLGLWAGLLGAPLLASALKGNGAVRDFGLRVKGLDPLLGAGVGIGTQFVLVPLLYWPIYSIFDVSVEELEEPARGLTDRATDPVGVILLVLIVGIGAPIVEEIFYRGLLQRSISHRFGVWPGIVGSGLIFGISHFQMLQLPALVVLGVVLAYVTERTGRLGPAIFSHVAFNMITVIYLVAA